ncbi:SKP1-like protein 1A [Argentina anserina]|uniref:SKP1-like protein 1A n=1 Tax=Argentina anserina TaxID=57926 RepID=UPI0021762AA2|nr:SKP1-like protein 1A [Potentilla anserina]
MSRVFKLRSSDNETFEIEEAAAMLSKTIKSSSSADIEVPNVKAEILGKVVEWCNKHAEREGIEDQLIKEWDAELLNVDQDVLFKLITAADYLQIKELVDQLTQRVADMIRAKTFKTVEMTRMTFDIKREVQEELKSVGF